MMTISYDMHMAIHMSIGHMKMGLMIWQNQGFVLGGCLLVFHHELQTARKLVLPGVITISHSLTCGKLKLAGTNHLREVVTLVPCVVKEESLTFMGDRSPVWYLVITKVIRNNNISSMHCNHHSNMRLVQGGSGWSRTYSSCLAADCCTCAS